MEEVDARVESEKEREREGGRVAEEEGGEERGSTVCLT